MFSFDHFTPNLVILFLFIVTKHLVEDTWECVLPILLTHIILAFLKALGKGWVDNFFKVIYQDLVLFKRVLVFQEYARLIYNTAVSLIWWLRLTEEKLLSVLGHVYFDLLADEDDGLLSISSQLSFASELRGNLIWIWPVPDSQTLHVELLVTFFENI